MPKTLRYLLPLLLLSTLARAQSPATTPGLLNWPNRNPIGQLSLGYERNQSPSNPLGLENPAPLVANCIENLKVVHGQGLIFWDADGLRSGPHPAGEYKGDPRVIPPFMDPFFKSLLKANLRVGVTLRCDTDYVGQPVGHEYLPDILTTRLPIVREKVAAAKSRGITLFYCDSAVGTSLDVLQIVAKENPDCLFIPEQRRPTDYTWAAPYMEFVPWSYCKTNYDVNPNAFTVFRMVGDTYEREVLPKHHDEVVERLKKGDVPLFNAWYRGPEFIPMVKALQEAGRPVEPLNPTALRETAPPPKKE